MTTLALDIGNTIAKAGVFEEGQLTEVATISPDALTQSLQKLLDKHPIQASIIASVANYGSTAQEQLQNYGPSILFNHRTTIPLQNRYATPETLGLDRLAAAVGGSALYPGRNILVIDAGTCITFDFVNEAGEYLGGAISPGLEMRLKALNRFTGRLPEVPLESQAPLVGQSTKDSILSGVVNGATEELEGIIQRYRQHYQDLLVLLTGGHSEIFETNLKSDIFAVSHLVLTGLNQILEHNDGS